MNTQNAPPKKETLVRPWFIASIVVTLLLIGLMGWNLLFSFNTLSSFKDRELAAERSSWKLLLHAETMQMATRLSTLSGNLKWQKTYDQTKPELHQALREIPTLTTSKDIHRKTGRIRTDLDNIGRIEKKAYDLVSHGDKKQARMLLAGWEYTKSQRDFEKTTDELVELIQTRIQKEIADQKTRALFMICLASVCLGLLAFLWTVTIRGWRNQVREKDRAKAGLQRSEEKYRLIFENAPLGFLHFDAKGRITACNDRFVDSLGSSRQKLIGLNMLGLPDQQIVSAVQDAISGKHGFFEGWYHAATTENVIHVRAFFAPLTDENGIIHGGMGIVEDTTGHVRMAEEKARLEEQYRQAQKVESIGRLAGGVAHDFNNLLSPILGYAEMLVSDLGPDDSRQKSAEEILYAGSRARDLVRKLLAFGRKQSMEYVPVDINQAVRNFEKLLRRTIREDITLELSLSPDIPMVMADIGQIEQVIMNLAINAADAMPYGGRLAIETWAAELDDTYTAAPPDIRPGRHLMLAVSDTGFGMDEETRALLFEPFFSTKGEQGTGLGLSTAYGIVKQHGGSIWVDSKPEAGTTLKVILPAADDCAAAENKTRETAGAGSCNGAETLLLAEDDPQVRELAHSVLSRQGYTVLTSGNADMAVNVMAQHAGPIHLLLTDVIMPEINGRELSAKIAAKHPGLRVLYMSGYTADVITRRGILEKDAAFIQKPFSITDLTAKVREVLNRNTGQDAKA